MVDHHFLNHALPTLPSDLLAALQHPFAPQEVRLRVGRKRQTREGVWQCLAMPVVRPRTYEARLDMLVPGGWSTASPSLVVAADHLTISAQVSIGSITHTDYGEMQLKVATFLPNEVEELIVSVPEAFEQAFVRVCARFGLGRYLADLVREWVPYDVERGCIALSPEQQQAHVLKLYQQAGVPFDLSVAPVLPIARAHVARLAPAPLPPKPVQEAEDQHHSAPEPKPRPNGSLERANARLRARNLAWVREHCAGKPLQSILRHFQLAHLEDISDADLAGVINGTHQHQLRQAS